MALNILINAISIKEGGSLVVVRQLVSEFAKARPETTWYVTTSMPNIQGLDELNNVKIISSSWAEKSGFHLRYWYENYLVKLTQTLGINLLYSLTNYLPKHKLSIPSLLLVQHAGHFSKLFDELTTKDMSFLQKKMWQYKKQWVRKSVSNATEVTVQTKALAKEINRENHLTVISHGPGLSFRPKHTSSLNPNKPVLGYVTKYGVQKNFSVLIETVKTLCDSGLNPQLILTLDENRPEVVEVMSEIAAAGIQDHVKNYGEVDQKDIQNIYHEIDIFVFPSLVESFGMPLLEAMSAGLPIVAADTLVNREILGKNAQLFSPHDASDLAEKLSFVTSNEMNFNKASENSLSRIHDFSWHNAAEKNLVLMDKMIGNA